MNVTRVPSKTEIPVSEGGLLDPAHPEDAGFNFIIGDATDTQQAHAYNDFRPPCLNKIERCGSDGFKLIRIPIREGEYEEELYDLAADPGELVNLVQARPDVAARLRDDLAARQRARVVSEDDADAPSAEDLEALRALGYID